MGIFDRFRQHKDDHGTDSGTSSPADAAVAGELLPAHEPSSRPEQLEELEESAREMVAPAFESCARIEESLVGLFVLDDDYDLTEDDVHQVLQRVWQGRLDEEVTWADEGDYGRLKAAFEALEGNGIVARMNFTCCSNCGLAEMEDERVHGSRGYVFFHEQDAERLTPGGSDLFLNFGGFDLGARVDASFVERAEAGEQEATEAAVVASQERIGAKVAAALRREGLTVEWDGTGVHRIQVTGLDWRKRLPAG